MNNDVNTATDIHIYKLKPWLILLNAFNLVLIGVAFSIPLMLMIVTATSSSRTETDFPAIRYSFLCLFAPLVLMMGFVLLQQVVNLVAIFFSYIKITPEGIENKYWPYRHTWTRWSEVDRLGKAFLYDVVYLKSYELMGLSLSFTKPLKIFNLFPPSIAVSTYNGWPDGQLASDLKHYAPHLFEPRPAGLEAQAAKQDSGSAGIPQEHRLLAALSHASVLLTGFGVLIPLIIYVTNKSKSAYLGFHTLQALFYQLIGCLISLLAPCCLIGVTILPVIGATMPGNETLFEPSMIVMMVFLTIMILLVALGGVAYVIYGMVGAIQAYQGKDFRYAIIGKQIEKRTGKPIQ